MAKLEPDASREYSRLLKECVQAHEKYESLLPKPVTVPAGARAKTIAFSETDLLLSQEADWQRLVAREALDRFRAIHGLT
jgi:hypothetical protein